MGGRGSSRWVGHVNAPTVESSFVLEARAFAGCRPDLVDSGMLELRGERFAWKMRTSYFIDLVVRPPRLNLSAEFLDRRITAEIELWLEPRHFGGAQLYFRCPGLGALTSCRRRVAKLYVPLGRPTHFACRHCHGLTYEAAQSKGTRIASTIADVWAAARRPELWTDVTPVRTRADPSR
jgi:hypothetical protein